MKNSRDDKEFLEKLLKMVSRDNGEGLLRALKSYNDAIESIENDTKIKGELKEIGIEVKSEQEVELIKAIMCPIIASVDSILETIPLDKIYGENIISKVIGEDNVPTFIKYALTKGVEYIDSSKLRLEDSNKEEMLDEDEDIDKFIKQSIKKSKERIASSRNTITGGIGLSVTKDRITGEIEDVAFIDTDTCTKIEWEDVPEEVKRVLLEDLGDQVPDVGEFLNRKYGNANSSDSNVRSIQMQRVDFFNSILNDIDNRRGR